MKKLLFALRVMRLIEVVMIAWVRLRYGKKGDKEVFTGVRVTLGGIRYEIRGEIVRLD